MRYTQSLDHSQAQSLWQVWERVAQTYPQVVALHDPHSKPELKLTYGELLDQIARFGAGLRQLGVQFQDKVALIADNSPRWFIADQGVLAIGAVDATRSSQAERQELLYILEHSDSIALVTENLATYEKLLPELKHLPIRFVVLLSDEQPPAGGYNFTQVLALGASKDLGNPPIDKSTLATLIYTSGTSGMPKGVMLSHGNLLHQVNSAPEVIKSKPIQPGDKTLSILPTWHSYERSFEYFSLGQGATQVYTNLRSIKKDLTIHRPRYMVAVPRLWESIYEGIQKNIREQPPRKQKLVHFFLQLSLQYIKARRIWQKLDLYDLEPSFLKRLLAGLRILLLAGFHKLGDVLVYKKIRIATGGNFQFIVSGGGSIAEHLEDFYEIIGIEILGGYGLTETAPITHVRRPERNLRYGDGQPLRHTEARIVDPESRRDLPYGQQGLVLLRGPQVMQGYYKNPEATAKAIDPDGWLDTGDLGWMTKYGDLIITGRAKDTIVLSNGENIEPQPIENACLRSKYIDQILLVGQDQKYLGALIVPNLPALEADNLIPPNSELAQVQDILNSEPIRQLFKEELNREVKNRAGYRPEDRIGNFAFVPEPFSIANGMMTQTFKIKRNVAMQHYADTIASLYQ
ncbi:MAG: AMP-dependent synthetase/ligase [Pseudanabaenaceae cyanobacterium]